MKKEFIRLSAVLCLITLVAAFLLAGVNEITAPVIKKAEEKATVDAMKKLLPEADTFTADENNANLSVATKDGQLIGFCAKVSANGYGGPVVMMVGVDTNMTVQGLEILTQSETAGLGAKITEDKFKEQFPGKNLDGLKLVKKATTSPQEFEAVTGATISSRAVESGITQAYEMINECVREGAQ